MVYGHCPRLVPPALLTSSCTPPSPQGATTTRAPTNVRSAAPARFQRAPPRPDAWTARLARSPTPSARAATPAGRASWGTRVLHKTATGGPDRRDVFSSDCRSCVVYLVFLSVDNTKTNRKTTDTWPARGQRLLINQPCLVLIGPGRVSHLRTPWVCRTVLYRCRRMASSATSAPTPTRCRRSAARAASSAAGASGPTTGTTCASCAPTDRSQRPVQPPNNKQTTALPLRVSLCASLALLMLQSIPGHSIAAARPLKTVSHPSEANNGQNRPMVARNRLRCMYEHGVSCWQYTSLRAGCGPPQGERGA